MDMETDDLSTVDLSNLDLETLPESIYRKKDLLHLKITTGNNIPVSERYKLIDILQNLQTIDGQDLTVIRNGIEKLTSIFERRLREMFLTKAASQIYNDPSTEIIRTSKMVELAQKTITAGPDVLKDFKNYKLEQLIQKNYEVYVSDALEIKLKKESEEEKEDSSFVRKRKWRKGTLTPNKKRRNAAIATSKKQEKKSSSMFKLQNMLQTHSKDNNPEDLKTKVWMCAFEPDVNDPNKTTNIVATCGGNSICFIDCNTGTVLKKYKQQNEEFYCLSWTILKYRNELSEEERQGTMLAVAGVNGDIKLIDPEKLVCFEKVSYHRKPVDALQFHPIIQQWLFSGSEDGTIVLWDLGYPFSTDVRKAKKQLVLKSSYQSTVRQIAIVPNGKILLGACDDGLYAWDVDFSSKEKKDHIRSWLYCFRLPSKISQAIDSTNMLSNNMLAMKRLGEGAIQIIYSKSQFGKDDLQAAMKLNWRQTETPFLKFNFTIGCSAIVAGDDEGTIWLYDMKDVVNRCKENSEKEELNFDDLPLSIKTQKLCCKNRYAQLFNNVCASSSLEHVVGVSDTNVVAIWKKVDESDDENDEEGDEEDKEN